MPVYVGRNKPVPSALRSNVYRGAKRIAPGEGPIDYEQERQRRGMSRAQRSPHTGSPPTATATVVPPAPPSAAPPLQHPLATQPRAKRVRRRIIQPVSRSCFLRPQPGYNHKYPAYSLVLICKTQLKSRRRVRTAHASRLDTSTHPRARCVPYTCCLASAFLSTVGRFTLR
jgi:hypothetical protein